MRKCIMIEKLHSGATAVSPHERFQGYIFIIHSPLFLKLPFIAMEL